MSQPYAITVFETLKLKVPKVTIPRSEIQRLADERGIPFEEMFAEMQRVLEEIIAEIAAEDAAAEGDAE